MHGEIIAEDNWEAEIYGESISRSFQTEGF